MTAPAPAVDPVIQTQVLGPRPNTAPTLKSIFRDPSYLKSLLIFSIIVNVLLLCGVVSLLSQRGSTRTPVTPSATATPTATATPVITETPDEARSRLLKCFNECEARDFLNSLKEETSKVQAYKSSGDYNNFTNSTCYGFYSEGVAPDKTFVTNHFPLSCEAGFAFSGPETTITIGARAYFATSTAGRPAWESRTVAPAGQTKLLDVVDTMQEQQAITSTYEQRGGKRVRVLTAESTKVNEFNQVVKTTVQLKVNDLYEIVYFFNSEERAFSENLRFWDYNVPNNIDAPIDL